MVKTYLIIGIIAIILFFLIIKPSSNGEPKLSVTSAGNLYIGGPRAVFNVDNTIIAHENTFGFWILTINNDSKQETNNFNTNADPSAANRMITYIDDDIKSKSTIAYVLIGIYGDASAMASKDLYTSLQSIGSSLSDLDPRQSYAYIGKFENGKFVKVNEQIGGESTLVTAKNY